MAVRVDLNISLDGFATRNRARGVNTVMGFGPTGGAVETDVIDVGRFEDGKLVEHWGIADQTGLLVQLAFDPRAAAVAQGEPRP